MVKITAKASYLRKKVGEIVLSKSGDLQKYATDVTPREWVLTIDLQSIRQLKYIIYRAFSKAPLCLPFHLK